MTLPAPVAPTRWRRIRVVAAKETRDHVRDLRSLVLALIYPFFGPLMIGILLSVSSASMLMSSGRMVTVGVQGARFAPGLIRYLWQHELPMVEVAAGDEALAIRSGRVPVVLRIGADAEGRDSFAVSLLVDFSRVASTTAAATLSQMVGGFGRETSRRLLAERGVEAGVLDPVRVATVQIGRGANIALFFYNLIAPLTIFMIFLGAVHLAIDTTVGERERGSWEPLLTAPVERWELLLGKAIAAFLFTAAAVGVNLATFRIVLGIAAAGNPGLAAPPDSITFAAMFGVALPLMALSVVLQLSIASIARSMKEAQIYLGLLPLVPALPGMAMVFVPLQVQTWMAAVPVLGQMMVFGQLVAGDPVAPLHLVLSAVTTGVVTVGMFRVATALFQREKLFFSG
ncbi:MAG: ABC transporter permease subunit [Azospirillum sp.]|nr:ABC transporter permease subunit [Azospirillum sp.]